MGTTIFGRASLGNRAIQQFECHNRPFVLLCWLLFMLVLLALAYHVGVSAPKWVSMRMLLAFGMAVISLDAIICFLCTCRDYYTSLLRTD